MPFSVLPGSATRSETTSPIGGIRHRKGMVILLIGAVYIGQGVWLMVTR